MMADHDSFVIDVPEDHVPDPTPQTAPLFFSTPYVENTSRFSAPPTPVSTANNVTVNHVSERPPNFQTLSPVTCLQLIPVLTSEQVRREYSYVMSLNPEVTTNIQIKNPRRPTLVEQRAVIREAIITEAAVVHDFLLDRSAQTNNVLIQTISCMMNKLEAQSRYLNEQTTSLAKSLEELHGLKRSVETPVSKSNLFTTPCTSRDTRDPDTDTDASSNTRTSADAPAQEVLFLTDSILNCFKPEKFKPRDSNSRMNITKFNLFKLRELDTYGFDKFNTVIISSGINDLSKYNCSPDTLFEEISNRLAQVNKNTKVIFRGLTPTRFDDINRLVYRFNNLMFDFCLTRSNMYYYDPYNFEEKHDFLYNRGNGIHISYHIAVYMSMNILNHAQFMYTRSGDHEHWPLRASLQDRFERHYN